MATTTKTIEKETTVKGGKLMDNPFVKQKEAKERQARLDQIQPVDVIGTMAEVKAGEIRVDRDEDGEVRGSNGGKFIQEPFFLPDGTPTTIAAKTREELEEKKAAIAAGLSGDGLFHELVCIDGMLCDCVGATPQELAEDIRRAEEFAVEHKNGHVVLDVKAAEELLDAGYEEEDLEEVQLEGGYRFILCYSERNLRNFCGGELVNLDDVESTLSRGDIKKLLLERGEAKMKEFICCDEEEEIDEFEEDDYEDFEDEDYDC